LTEEVSNGPQAGRSPSGEDETFRSRLDRPMKSISEQARQLRLGQARPRAGADPVAQVTEECGVVQVMLDGHSQPSMMRLSSIRDEAGRAMDVAKIGCAPRALGADGHEPVGAG